MFPKLSEMKKIRERIGWSQAKLAKEIGRSQSLIPKYENGQQMPGYDIAIKIFEVLLKEDYKVDTEVNEIMTTKIISVKPTDTVDTAKQLMAKHSISQIPVVKNNVVVGTIHESIWLDILSTYHNYQSIKHENVTEIMKEGLPMVPKTAKVKEITHLLRSFGAVIVIDQGKIIGIVTSADLLDID
ncbi:MAG: CBS domain-containing protein [Candidatus Heimdallarchaeota archaeon]|nr:CBS domain-containing protein [Candidatus Heimdallarchaeota archaeon]